MKLDSEQLSKKDVALLALLGARDSVFVHVDSRRPGVRLPASWLNKPQVVLQFGRALVVPIPDLDVSSAGIRATLSFNRSPHSCFVPWAAVYAIISDSGEGAAYVADIPEEVLSEIQPTPAEEKKPRPAWLKVIEGGKQ